MYICHLFSCFIILHFIKYIKSAYTFSNKFHIY